MSKKSMFMASMLLVIAGAINWGLLGLFEYNLVVEVVDFVFSGETVETVSRGIYILVGLAGVYLLADHVSKNSK